MFSDVFEQESICVKFDLAEIADIILTYTFRFSHIIGADINDK